MKSELSQKAKLSIYRSIFVPILTYGHEGWVMTERTRSRIQAAEMGFLSWVDGISHRDRVRSFVIREGTQSRAAAHLRKKEPVKVVRASGKDATWSLPSGGVPCTSSWEEATLAWECLGIPQSELADVAGKWEVWETLLELLPPRPDLG